MFSDTDSNNSPFGNEERQIQELNKDSPTFNIDLYITLQNINQRLNAKSDDFYSSIETPISRHFLPIETRYDDKNFTYRQLYRVCIDMENVVSGQTKSKPHGIIMQGRMAVVKIWAVGTRTKENGWDFARQIGTPNITINDTNINVTPNGNFDQCFATVEYIRVLKRDNQ